MTAAQVATELLVGDTAFHKQDMHADLITSR